MSYQNRPLNSSLRHPSTGGSQSNSGQSPVLLARINEKKVELENLKQLRDLSGGLAAQMQALEEKLLTLSDGTEVKVPKPLDDQAEAIDPEPQTPLPQTLVRIPIENQTDALQAQDTSATSD
ncbi:MAG: hypothetical protein Q9164_002514 [Protoblastenia rupestris]